jgi:hypothetical protein
VPNRDGDEANAAEEESVTEQDGIRQIDEAQWERDRFNTLFLNVNTKDGAPIQAWLTMRPLYCDRGHIQLNIDGLLELDAADRFPRHFFSFEEADAHTRMFLKWRLWKVRTYSYDEVRRSFASVEIIEKAPR